MRYTGKHEVKHTHFNLILCASGVNVMKAQVLLKDKSKQFWLEMSERRAFNAYWVAGGKESWESYAKRRCGNRIIPQKIK